jgi:hypothetical protein
VLLTDILPRDRRTALHPLVSTDVASASMPDPTRDRTDNGLGLTFGISMSPIRCIFCMEARSGTVRGFLFQGEYEEMMMMGIMAHFIGCNGLSLGRPHCRAGAGATD